MTASPSCEFRVHSQEDGKSGRDRNGRHRDRSLGFRLLPSSGSAPNLNDDIEGIRDVSLDGAIGHLDAALPDARSEPRNLAGT
jgi:hypothetical protein